MAMRSVLAVPGDIPEPLGDWTDRGACRTCDPAIDFFPDRGADTRPAKAVCAGCPVQAPCLDDALADGARPGIWAGTSERQRKQIRRDRRQAAKVESLERRLDIFEARLPADLLDEWRALRQALTGTPSVATIYADRTNVRSSNRARFERKNPAPGMRLCSKCGPLVGPKPIAEFNVMNKKDGRLRSECKECYNERTRNRYLRVGQRAVNIELLDGDALVGQLCPGCNLPFFVGERVVADHVCHMGCESDG